VANYLANRFLPVKFGQGAAATAMFLENAVLQDLVSLAGSVDAVETYRASNRVSTELDFVVTLADTVIPLEVKSASSVKHNTLSQLFDFCDRNGVREAFVVYAGPPRREQVRGTYITYLPPYLVHRYLGERFGVR
jgi:predicted AAA+ superfamily ATPase